MLERFDPSGFVFHTNLDSPKCQDLAQNPRARAGVPLARTRAPGAHLGQVVPAS